MQQKRRVLGSTKKPKPRRPVNLRRRIKVEGVDPSADKQPKIIEIGPNGEELVDDSFAGIKDNFGENLESTTSSVERFTGPRPSGF
jgi:hypothetical protein